ncbi:lanthionine synthetase LanC family protein [Actinokineospora spheciospongiae]|uniref:lanthionine synthetase LanC family protein n=1 Tax=Actinokineospora spheciospongiae TaxID=909613 RepID=UPI000D70EB3B|nr:lanthionine synthetase LanC family protein [Actinokineospora spheciospongiae]PWW53075.1 lanthionine synthetase-like protein [Actinokineospora spheciospongiae]
MVVPDVLTTPRNASTRDLLLVADHVLTSWTARHPMGTAGPDLGPAVLSTLVAAHPDATGEQRRTCGEATDLWLRTGLRGRAGTGLHDGLSGLVAGLGLIAGVRPDVGPAAQRAARSLATAADRRPWRTSAVGFTDYDLVSGPAGTLLAQPAGTPPGGAAAHLAALAADPDLAGLRIGAHRDHPLVGWTQGDVVTGLAHGAAGVLAALSAVDPTEEAVRAVAHLSTWLVAGLYVDGAGIVSWRYAAGGKPEAVAHRQGWCYGNPGVSWALWAAGRALVRAGAPGGEDLCDLAVRAVGTLCGGYDADVHLDGDRDSDRLGVCHGAAGVLLVADAFARHTGSAPAAALRDWLTGHLHDRLDRVARLAGTDTTLLSGATGVLAALLTTAGADRGWLRCLALS